MERPITIALNGNRAETMSGVVEQLLDHGRNKRPITLLMSNQVSNPLTEEDIVLACIAFANGATLTFSAETVPAFVIRTSQQLGISPNIEVVVGARKILITNPFWRRTGNWNDSQAAPPQLDDMDLRLAIKVVLKSLISKATSIEDSIAKHAQYFTKGIGMTVETILSDGNLSIRHHYRFESSDNVAALGALLLTDKTLRYRKMLCQCGWRECNQFFLVRRGAKGGRPLREYCDSTHGDKAHTANASIRMKANRRRNKESKNRVKRR
jgi:hypothetical protein